MFLLCKRCVGLAYQSIHAGIERGSHSKALHLAPAELGPAQVFHPCGLPHRGLVEDLAAPRL